MSLRHFVSSFAALGVLSLAAPSFADVVPPEVTDCEGHDIGESCTLTGVEANGPTSGTCQKSTCTSLSYSCDGGSAVDSGGEDSDAAPHGGPCGSTTYDCNKCVAEPPNGGDGGSTTTNGSSDSGGCSASPADPVTGFGSVLLAGSIFAALFLRRKKNEG